MATQSIPLRSPVEFESRICATTNLRVHIVAQQLVLTNAATAIVFLLVGGIMGILLGLTRWPQLGLLSAVPAFFWSLGWMGLDPQVYRLNFWSIGHPA